MSDMLKDRTVLVTGAARGLGRAFAEAAGAAGARLILADILVDLCHETAAELSAQGFKARAVGVDLADPSSIEAMAADIAAHEGKVDGLVNNAAIATNVGGMGFEAISLDLWDRVQTVNVRGTWLVIKAVTPMMGEGGRIVNLASDTALWGVSAALAFPRIPRASHGASIRNPSSPISTR